MDFLIEILYLHSDNINGFINNKIISSWKQLLETEVKRAKGGLGHISYSHPSTSIKQVISPDLKI